MKKISLMLIVGFISAVILVACNGEDDSDGLEAPVEDPDEGPGDPSEDPDEEGGLGEVADESDLITESEFDDQTGLEIGDTAQVQTNLDAFEITLHSVSSETEMGGESSQLDQFVIADVTVTNIHDDVIDADTAKGTFELASSTDGSGFSDLSGQGYEGIEPIEGELGPSESAEGQMVFQIEENEVYYLRVIQGLLASDGVLNDVQFTFTGEEFE